MELAEKKGLESNIIKFYLFYVLFGMAFFIPIIVLFWQENGLTITEIMVLQSFFSLFVILLEVPSGYFADLYGRKITLIASSVFWTVGLFTYSLGHNFTQFLVAEFLWAIGSSLFSGTDTALLYDSLLNLGREKDFKEIIGKAHFFRLMSLSVACVLGGFIAKMGFRWTFIAMQPFYFALIPLALSLAEPVRRKRIISKNYLSDLRKVILNHVIHKPEVRWLIVYGAVIGLSVRGIMWLYQPYFKVIGLALVYFGFIFAAMNLVAAISAKYSYSIEAFLGRKNSLILLVVLVGSGFFLMSTFVFFYSFVFVFLFQFIRAFEQVVLSDYVK